MKIILLGLSILLPLSNCEEGNLVNGSYNYVVGASNKVLGNRNQQVTYNVAL